MYQKLSSYFSDLDLFLALRGLASIAVVIYHVHFQTDWRHATLLGSDISWLIWPDGTAAVWIFFVLSGYLMGKAFYAKRYPLTPHGIWSFFQNRIRRIFPLYYFITLVLIIFIYSSLLEPQNWVWLLHILTFTYNHGLPINFSGTFWSLSTEVQFYLLVPVVALLMFKTIRRPLDLLFAVIAVVVLGLTIRYYAWHAHWPFQNRELFQQYFLDPLHTNLDIFLIGFLVNPAIALLQKMRPRAARLIGLLPVLILFIFLSQAYAVSHFASLSRYNILAPTLTALLIASTIFIYESVNYRTITDKSKLALARSPRLLERLGTLSYGIYLWHLPILIMVVQRSSNHFLHQFPIALVYVLGLSILLSYLTYRLVEVPLAQKAIQIHPSFLRMGYYLSHLPNPKISIAATMGVLTTHHRPWTLPWQAWLSLHWLLLLDFISQLQNLAPTPQENREEA